MAKRACKGSLPDGTGCRVAAVKGSDYCFWHDPKRRAAHRDAARRGGRAREPVLSPDDREAIIARLEDPVLWGEHYLRNRDGSRRRYWPHQVEDLRCPALNIVHQDGRAVGKTISLSTDVLHFAFTGRGRQGLIAAPHQGHLDTIIDEVEHQINACEELNASIAKTAQGHPKIVRKPYFRIEFTNRSVLHFRPAGSYGDAFRSLHVDRLWVDEGAWLTEKAWQALRQCLKAGGVFRIYSTPSGVRNTTYFRMTEAEEWKVFRWPSWLNPAWSAEREAELAQFYGGKDTAAWQHEVAGEHGKQVYGAFSAEGLGRCLKTYDEYQAVSITGESLAECESEAAAFNRLEMLLNLGPQDGTFWIGGDLGYTNDPTELVVFHETSDEGKVRMKLVLRVHMEHVAYPHISEAIALLDRYYAPLGIGVDKGGNGLAVVQELTTLDKYRQLNLESRLHGYDFGSAITIAEQNGQLLKKRAKEHMTSLINGALHRGELRLPEGDVELVDQFTTHSYQLVGSNTIFSKGNDHIVDAVRCAMLARDQRRLDEVEVVVPRLQFYWTDEIFP
ncbi:MAG TPA: hypothetical protein PLE19_23880 [Planctomycetota bacterium]|nr:hypothetical protein [Planctomycetota bacterium]HRR82700.1 hypothetical protein [Planctomycetota bacterium]HRT94208.1 hypothetical protein [Planctomycetota bacterium]